ncbi:MAG TPA: AraC family transcriptional regulator [Steroidobacteraceae bacterium]|nr:AraC family transcriptional regulator [Steroidobacteraceae bacterium]
MRPTATGRILFWRGGSLWIGLAGEATSCHAHHAVQIALPFPHGRVRFQDRTGNWTSYSAALVPAHQPHAFEARAQRVAQIFVEPESRDGRNLQRRYHNEAIVALQSVTLEHEIAELAAAYEARASDTALIELAGVVIATLSESIPGPTTQPDERIARAVELVREQLGDAIPLGKMAAAVHLSPDRFRHLFVKETGVSFRAYLLWQRLERSLAAYVAGATLTDAAHTGGFADSAHFSRTFRRMFGIAPGSVRPE